MALKVFMTGATGFIGGSVLANLLKHPAKFQVTALVRSPEAAKKLITLNVTPLLGSLDDSELIIKASEETDIVINAANADHLGAVKAIISGLSNSSKPKIFIHTSGTGVVVDDAQGNVTTSKVYSDLDMETIHSLPISQPHRDVDHYIFEHSHNIDTLIIAPPTIYGLGTGPFKRHSYKIPEIIRSGVKYGQVATLGKGVNMWNCVHVEDLADFYILALEKALEGKADIRKEGWYFVEDGQYVFRDLVQKISEVILERKLIKTPEILHWTPKYVEELYGAYYARAMGSNSLCKGERSRALGWIPKKGNIFSSIEEEVDALIADNLL